MRIKKVYNNNIVLAEDEKGLEHIILGRGIAFQQKMGNLVEDQKVEKVFEIKSDQTMNKFLQLLNEVPVNHLELTTRIVEAAEADLGVKFDDAIYIGLTDHINYAIDRAKNKIKLKNGLLWEIRRHYYQEFKAAKRSLELIAYYEGIWLDDDEAGHIALHFVNARQGGEEMSQTIVMTQVIEEIMKIIQYSYQIELDESSLSYGRLLTHLKFFLARIWNQELEENVDDSHSLFIQVEKKYPEAARCVDKIITYLENKFDYQIFQQERMYLILHVHRLSN